MQQIGEDLICVLDQLKYKLMLFHSRCSYIIDYVCQCLHSNVTFTPAKELTKWPIAHDHELFQTTRVLQTYLVC